MVPLSIKSNVCTKQHNNYKHDDKNKLLSTPQEDIKHFNDISLNQEYQPQPKLKFPRLPSVENFEDD